MPEILFLLALVAVIVAAAAIIVWPRRSPQTATLVFTIDTDKVVAAFAQYADALRSLGDAVAVSATKIQEFGEAWNAAGTAGMAPAGPLEAEFDEPARARAQADADDWNNDYPPGTPLRYWLWIREERPTGASATSAPARVSRGRAVVDVEGVSGGVALTHVEPIARNPEGHAA